MCRSTMIGVQQHSHVCSPAAMSSSRWITLLRLTSFTWSGGMVYGLWWRRRIIDHWDWTSIRSLICPTINWFIQSFKHAFIHSGSFKWPTFVIVCICFIMVASKNSGYVTFPFTHPHSLSCSSWHTCLAQYVGILYWVLPMCLGIDFKPPSSGKHNIAMDIRCWNKNAKKTIICLMFRWHIRLRTVCSFLPTTCRPQQT